MTFALSSGEFRHPQYRRPAIWTRHCFNIFVAMFANDGVGLDQLGAVWASLMGRQDDVLLGLMLGLDEKSDQESYDEEEKSENPEASIIMSLLLCYLGWDTSQRSGENEGDE